MTENVEFLYMTSPEIEESIKQNKVLIFSVGAVEQHGPHLVSGTCGMLPFHIAIEAAKKVGAVVAPSTNYGYKSIARSGGGSQFAGTVNLRGTTVISLVKDIISEFIRVGWKKILVLDWHFENHTFVYEGVDEAVREARDVSDLKVVRVNNIVDMTLEVHPELIDFVFGGDYKGMIVEHASAFETSLMMAAYPEHVRFDKLVDGRIPEPFDYDVLPTPPDYVSENGVFWKATQGTAEKGERLIAVLVETLVKVIEKEF